MKYLGMECHEARACLKITSAQKTWLKQILVNINDCQIGVMSKSESLKRKHTTLLIVLCQRKVLRFRAKERRNSFIFNFTYFCSVWTFLNVTWIRSKKAIHEIRFTERSERLHQTVDSGYFWEGEWLGEGAVDKKRLLLFIPCFLHICLLSNLKIQMQK